MFPATCVPHTSYYSTPEFLLNISHYLTFISFPVSFFGAYCILYKTPVQMNSLKWLMLNLHFWTSSTDFLLIFIGIPYILMPTMSGFGLGIMKHTGILLYFFITILEASAVSVIAIFENRYFVMFAQKSRWRHYRKPFLTAISSLVPLVFLPPYFDIPNQTFAREVVYSQLPCVVPFEINGRPLFVLSVDLKLPLGCLVFNSILWSSLASIFFFLTIFKLWKGTERAISQKTINLQKKLAFAVIFQTIVLVIFLLAPVCICLFVITTDYHNQSLNNFSLIILSLHGLASTIAMLFVNKPYREFTFSLVFCWRLMKNNTTPRSNVHSLSVIF